MAPKAPWHIFYKSFQNQATPEELTEIKNWLGEDIENQKMLDEVYHIYTISTELPPPVNPNIQKAWSKVDQKISSKPITKSLNYKLRYAAIAAVLVFGLMLWGIVDNYLKFNRLTNQFAEVVTLPGQKTSVILPDGSRVWLNSASSLKYPTVFNASEREVILAGEAFFEVHKDQSKKFRVRCGNLDVNVHGTSFNVKNYPDENLQEVTVAEGIVGITNHSKEIKQITKGEQATLNKVSGEVIFDRENPDLVSAWKNNELIFRNTPIEEVIKALESWYGVKINVDKKLFGGHNYTFKLKTETFKEVLNMMQVMTPLEYKINGKDVDIKYNN
jgi:ferric-dicitrate binding protein FerR (iron transport regulator)